MTVCTLNIPSWPTTPASTIAPLSVARMIDTTAPKCGKKIESGVSLGPDQDVRDLVVFLARRECAQDFWREGSEKEISMFRLRGRQLSLQKSAGLGNRDDTRERQALTV